MTVGCTSLTIYPAGIAISVMFLFPDWQTNFYLVDNVTAGLERFIAVSGRYADPDRALADFQQTDSMHTAGVQD